MKYLIVLMTSIFTFGLFSLPDKERPSILYFQFTGDEAIGDEYTDPDNWELTNESGVGCSAGSMPCVVKSDNLSGVTDENSFANYLDNLGDDGESYVDNHTESNRP